MDIDNITNAGTKVHLPENFAMMIPKEALKFKKPPFFKAWSQFGYWHFKIRKPRYPKLLDKILRPLCRFGLHRWKGTYGYISYSIWQYDTPDAKVSDEKQEDNFQCARCKKTKTTPKK